MKTRASHALRNFLVGMALGLLILLVIGGAAFFLLRDRGPRSQGPAVTIRAPQFGEQLTANQSMIVHAMAEDFRGVARVELWVDQQLLSVQTSQLPEGSTPFPLTYNWYPEQAGSHLLVVRAYNRAGGTGQATVRVEAMANDRGTAQMSYQVAEGDTLASIATRYGLTPEGIASENPGLTEPLTPGGAISISLPPTDPEGIPADEPGAPEPLPGEEPPDPLGVPARLPLSDLLSRLPFSRTGASAGTWIEVEVLSLEVDKEYDGVYCYYSLAGAPFERVPADGYFAGLGERRWGIEEAMGGDRTRVVVLPDETDTLDLNGNCMGYRSTGAGGEAFDLGTLTISHTLAEADGTTILKEINGRDGWFRVGYGLHEIPSAPSGPPPRPGVAEVPPPAGPLPAPALSGTCDRGFLGDSWAVECQLAWTVPADSSGVSPWVDGFILLRNGALLETLPAGGAWRKTLSGSWLAIAPTIIDESGRARTAAEWGDLPAPGESYDFQVVYYQGAPLADAPEGYRSPPSNIFTLTGDMWPGSVEVTVTIHALHVTCIDSDRDDPQLCWDLMVPGPLDSTGMPTGGCSYFCSGDPEDWGSGAYGGINVNGSRVLNIHYPINSGARYNFPPSYGTMSPPTITVTLSPFQSLVITSRMWDYDVWSADDPFCHGVVAMSPRELLAIRDGVTPAEQISMFKSREGMCHLRYTVEVR